MNSPTERQADVLPVLFLRFDGPQTNRQLLEPVFENLKKRSISTLLLTLASESAEPWQSATADVLHLAAPELLALSYGHRRQLLLDHASRAVAEYDLVLIDAAEPHGRDDTGGVDFSRPDNYGLQPLLRYGDPAQAAKVSEGLYGWLEEAMVCSPLWSCLLIGGKSSRMGRPKHLIEDRAGVSWVERAVCLLSEQSDGIVLAGAGEVPPSLKHLPRLADIDGVRGPLAGIVAAMRWKPNACWLISACDMPMMRAAAVEWLLQTRKPGIWGSVPCQPQSQRLEPLFAHYDFRARSLFEAMVSSGQYRLSGVGAHDKIATPPLPEELRLAWQNFNFPQDLDRIT